MTVGRHTYNRFEPCAVCGDSEGCCMTATNQNPAAVNQCPPMANTHPAIQDLVCEDMQARKALGIKKYGTALQGYNGRDALMDAYQEALDLVNYMRQQLFERDGR